MFDLRANPFYLDDKAVQWVESTLQHMSLQEKIGQLFCIPGVSTDPAVLQRLTRDMGIGGIMYRTMSGSEVQSAHRVLQQCAKIPLLTAANLESGGIGIAAEGTAYASPMQVAATDDDELAFALGKISCGEGAAVGCNWSFAPVVDIDMNFRNPITNLRTFGSDPDRVIRMAKRYMDAAREEGVAVSVKHFPGDGVDERDQHLLTSVNSLSAEDWDSTYGRVYKALIDHGAQTVMAAHIALPAWSKALNPELGDRPIPASLSKELVQGLLRERLGFNGLVVTDASQMVGFTTALPRQDAIPGCIAAGCDMILFTKNVEEDIAYLIEGYNRGTLTEDRLNEAVARILAVKASLRLHEKQASGTLVPEPEALTVLRSERAIRWSEACADRSITLVKNVGNLLPISSSRHRRVYLNVLASEDRMDNPLRQKLKMMFEQEGFEVCLRNRDFNVDMGAFLAGQPDARTMEVIEEIGAKVADFKNKFDLAIYVADLQAASNTTVIRLSWKVLGGMGDDAPWFAAEVPTLFISLGNPYHLLDVPMVKAFVNAYSDSDFVLDSLIEKLMGRSPFKGKSPVDAFCGRTDLGW